MNKNRIKRNWRLIGIPLAAAGLLLAGLLAFFSQFKLVQVSSAAALIPEAWLGGTKLPNETIGYAFAQCPEDPDRFYIIGGMDDDWQTSGWLTDTYRYDVSTGYWNERAPVPIAVYGASAVCYKGKIYYAGGGTPVTDTLYIYDIATNAWSFDSTLPRQVWAAALGAWDGKLYLVGGTDEDFGPGLHPVNQVDVYDIATHTWTADALLPMPIAASAPGYDQTGPYLYLVGGYSGNYSFNITATQRLDLSTGQWETGPAFSSARAFPTTALTEQHLYASGGDANGDWWLDSSPLVEVLDLSDWPNGSWQVIGDNLPNPTQGNMSNACTEVLVGGEIWSVGGMNGEPWDIYDTNLYHPAEPCIHYGLALIPESLSGEGEPDEAIDYVLTLTNTGNTTDYFSLTASSLWAINLPETVGPLGAGESEMITVSVIIPADAKGGDSDTAIVTAASISNPAQVDSSTITTTYMVVYDMELDVEEIELSGMPGEVVTYTLVLSNQGNITDTYDMDCQGDEWPMDMPVTQVTLAPEASADVILTVHIPLQARPGQWDAMTFTAVSQGDPNEAHDAELITTAIWQSTYLPVVVR